MFLLTIIHAAGAICLTKNNIEEIDKIQNQYMKMISKMPKRTPKEFL